MLPFSKATCSSLTLYFSQANSIKRFLIVNAAASAALPFKSVPEEAAVGEVFSTLYVRYADEAMVSTSN